MNDIVIGVWVTAAASGSVTAWWIRQCLRADAGSMWRPKPDAAEPRNDGMPDAAVTA